MWCNGELGASAQCRRLGGGRRRQEVEEDEADHILRETTDLPPTQELHHLRHPPLRSRARPSPPAPPISAGAVAALPSRSPLLVVARDLPRGFWGLPRERLTSRESLCYRRYSYDNSRARSAPPRASVTHDLNIIRRRGIAPSQQEDTSLPPNNRRKNLFKITIQNYRGSQ
jgi:hypothetical protein